MKDSKISPKPVSILMHDIRRAQELSRFLRRKGEVVYFYDSLEKFWKEVITDQSKLMIVDVALMSSGPLILKNHPLLQNEGVPLIFAYDEMTTPLLMSTRSFLHMGLLKDTSSWEQDLTIMLKRVGHFDAILGRYRSMESLLKRRESSLKDSQAKLTKANETLFYKNEFSRLFYELQKEMKSQDFLSSVVDVLDSWKAVKKSTIFSLDSLRKKIISEKLEGAKYSSFPDIWPGDYIGDGLTPDNVETLFEVVVSNWGINTLCLKLRQNEEEIDHCVFIKVDQSYFDKFSWHEWEERLNYIFIKDKIGQGEKFNESKLGLSTVYDLFDALDRDFCQDKIVPSIALFDVNLEGLTDLILSHPDNQFSFQSFYKNFVMGIKKLSQISLDCVATHHEHIAITADYDQADYVFKLVTKYVKSFPYFRYFDGDEVVFADSPDIKVQMIPTSSEAYRKFLENGSELIYHKSASDFREAPGPTKQGFSLNEI